MDSIEKLYDEVETVNGFCEATITARVEIGWVWFRERGELLFGNRFPLKMAEKVCNTTWKRDMVFRRN